MNRVSCFQKEIHKREKVSSDVLQKAFYSLYWLAKEIIACTKAKSLLQLLTFLNLPNIEHFNHRSAASLREIFLTLGNTILDGIKQDLQNVKYFGLLIDDVTDI